MIGGRQAVLSVTCACITCTWNSVKPREQIMGKLPLERISADYMFCRVGGDFTGPFHIKLGHTRSPIIVKAYTCIFVCLLVKATHIEAVLDMSTEAFIACSSPSLIMSDHGSNFIGATREIREIKEFTDFLNQQKTQKAISKFCISQLVQWQFIPKNSPHFGRLHEAAVFSMKIHLHVL